MRIRCAGIRITGLLLVTLAGLLTGARPGVAFVPKMDYWFIETLQLGEVELPDGVFIRACDTSSQPRSCLIVENQTETLLFVLSLSYRDRLVMVTPDPEWKLRLGLAHEVASFLAAPQRPASLSIEALVDLDKNLVDQNVLTYYPPPKNLAIPASENSELLLVYGGQVIEVPFTLSYSLNMRFDNGSEEFKAWMDSVEATASASATTTQKAIAYTNRLESTMWAGGLFMLAVILVGGWLVWRGIALPKNRT